MNEWQPIETAPRDGRRITVRWRDGSISTTCAHVEAAAYYRLHCTDWRPCQRNTPMREWKPIKWAPSALPVIVWAEYDGMVIAVLNPTDATWYLHNPYAPAARLPFDPTHWMSLPNPPEE